MRAKNIWVLVFLVFATPAFSQLKTIKLDNAEISYLDKGSGQAIVFVHGAMEDYRTWEQQMDSFSKKYRVIAYSRRLNWPNHNNKEIKNFSGRTEAKDLAELITKLNIQPVHLVGHSYGGLVSLFLALEQPKLVRSLTLSEAGMVNWLPGIPGGKPIYDSFYNNLWKPVKQAFEQKDSAAVLRHTFLYFYGTDLTKDLSPEILAQINANFSEWRAIAFSSDAFPPVSKEEVKSLKMPVFLLSAGQTIRLLQLTNMELKRQLPYAYSFHLAEGTHDYWMTHPRQMGDALMNFLKFVSKN